MQYKPLLRLFWICLYVPLISFMATIVITLWDKLSLHSTVTTMVSSTYPVNQIPFPAVSVCSLNKISKRRAQNLSEFIANATRQDPEEIMSYMKYIGQLYDFDFEPASVTRLLEFQNILDKLGLSVIEVTKMMATPCEELLAECFWRGAAVNCSRIFQLRLTYHGHCCTFNYVKITEELANATGEDEAATTDAGVENGLRIAVSNDLGDYFYTTLSSPGVMVNIFVPTDYPDKTSGGVTEIFTQPNSENFVEIVPSGLISVDEVARYSVEKRDCLFVHERRLNEFRGIYSQSDCNVICRVQSIQALCQCVPFTIPYSKSNTVCTLADIPCLSRYKDNAGLHLRKEMHDSLICDTRCYSPCAETVYQASINSFPIFNKSYSDENLTIIYVYYLHRFSKLYRQDVVYYWFEILSNFGGIIGIFVGWSLISMIQFIFYHGRKVAEKFIRSILVADVHSTM